MFSLAISGAAKKMGEVPTTNVSGLRRYDPSSSILGSWNFPKIPIDATIDRAPAIDS